MPKQSLKQIAYQSIKEKILTCQYEPNSFLNEDLLCDEFQMSRTPIRDALGRMEQENLITIVPKKGFFVAPLSINEINMVFEGRLLLEPYFILTYCSPFPQQLLDQMYRTIEDTYRTIERASDDFYIHDDEFHQCIVSRCSNRYLTRTYNDICNQNSRLRILSGRHNNERLTSTVEEHAKIVNALASGDLQSAAERMREHLTNAKSSYYETFLNQSAAQK